MDVPPVESTPGNPTPPAENPPAATKNKGGRPKGSRSRKTLERELRETKAKLASFEQVNPFAGQPHDQAKAEEKPPAGEQAPPASTTPPPATVSPKLGEEGARQLLKFCFDIADAGLPYIAHRFLAQRLGIERAAELAPETEKVMRLRPDERQELEAVLVAKLADLEMDPDTFLYLAVGKVLVRMGSGVMTVAETGRAPSPGEPTILEKMMKPSWPAADRVDPAPSSPAPTENT